MASAAAAAIPAPLAALVITQITLSSVFGAITIEMLIYYWTKGAPIPLAVHNQLRTAQVFAWILFGVSVAAIPIACVPLLRKTRQQQQSPGTLPTGDEHHRSNRQYKEQESIMPLRRSVAVDDRRQLMQDPPHSARTEVQTPIAERFSSLRHV